MPVSNRQYSLFSSKSINSTMPMVFDRDDYDPPKKKSTTKSPKRIAGYKVMELINLTPNNKAEIAFLRNNHPNKKHKSNPITAYKYVTPYNITNNDIAGIRLVTR